MAENLDNNSGASPVGPEHLSVTGTPFMDHFFRNTFPDFYEERYNELSQFNERTYNSAEAEKQRQFEAAEAQKNRDYQTEMSNTAYQRAMADMKKAGLNPILAYQQGGASTPSGSSAHGTAAHSSGYNRTSGNSRSMEQLQMLLNVAGMILNTASGYIGLGSSSSSVKQSRTYK